MRHLALLLLAACTTSTNDAAAPSDTNLPSGSVSETPVGDPVTVTVGPEGGEVAVTADGVTWRLDVPAGALDSATPITATPVTLVDLDGPIDGVGLGVAFAPSGLQFATPATLTATGYAPDELAVGFVWSDDGPVEWQVPGGTADTWTLQVPHFSGGGLASFLPEPFIDLMDKLGALPEAQLDAVAAVPGFGDSSRFACATVTNGAGRAQPNLPVRFAVSGSDDEAGFLSDPDLRTIANGRACVQWNSRGTPGPFGTLVELKAIVLEGAPFEFDVATTFMWGGELPGVTLTGVTNGEELAVGTTREVCATLSFDDARPTVGYPIELTSLGSPFLPLAFQGSTNGGGQACASFTVPESDNLGDDGQTVDVAARVRLGPGRESLDLRSVFVVDGALLALTFAPALPARVAPGSDAIDVCVDVTLNDLSVGAVTVSFGLAGDGTLQDASAFGANGRVCTRYQPPATATTSPDVITAAATLNGRDGTVSHAITVVDAPQAVDYSGTYSESFTHTRVDGLGRRMDGDGAGQGSASFRLRRHPDGTWEGLEVSGIFTQSYYEICDLTETITFQTTGALVESNDRLSLVLQGPAEGVSGRRGSIAGCSLVPVASSGRFLPVAVLQPDGSYRGQSTVSQMDPNGTVRVETATVALTPE